MEYNREIEVEIKVSNLNYKYILNIKLLMKISQEIDHCQDIKNRFRNQIFYPHLI